MTSRRVQRNIAWAVQDRLEQIAVGQAPNAVAPDRLPHAVPGPAAWP
ncbi:MAG: hypothetical protein IPO15_23470 [Anaerolineae bacterium]|nr:hypothetical protein [Anaerolineae bacterium]